MGCRPPYRFGSEDPPELRPVPRHESNFVSTELADLPLLRPLRNLGEPIYQLLQSAAYLGVEIVSLDLLPNAIQRALQPLDDPAVG